MKTMAAVLTAALLAASAAWVTKAPAQAQAPAPGAAKQIEGKVKAVDIAKLIVTLEDGTTLAVADAQDLAGVRPGAMIKASYQDKGGQKVATSLEVKGQ